MRGPEQHHSETKKFGRTETEEAPFLFPAVIAVKKFSAAMRGRASSHRIAHAIIARVARRSSQRARARVDAVVTRSERSTMNQR
jgi:hypothetical protein